MQILSLRRLAEAEAQAALRLCRGELERAQWQLEQARRSLVDAEQQLQRARAGQGPQRIEAAAQLQRESIGLCRKAEAVRQKRLAVERAAVEAGHVVERLEQHRAALLACMARREAAELHEALERREQKRLRATRERSHDDEARDRFALTRVK